MTYRALAFLAALALLGACAEKPATTGAATGTGATASTTGGAVPGSQQDLVANVGDRVFFAFDQSNLSGDARATLDRQAAWLQRYPQVSVQLAGNCDERGTEEYNLQLSNKRAAAVKKYLTTLGLPARNLDTVGYGETRPATSASDEEAWSQNRRVEFRR